MDGPDNLFATNSLHTGGLCDLPKQEKKKDLTQSMIWPSVWLCLLSLGWNTIYSLLKDTTHSIHSYNTQYSLLIIVKVKKFKKIQQ